SRGPEKESWLAARTRDIWLTLSSAPCGATHDEIVLFGQDQFAQARGLQAIDRSVVADLDGFAPLQKLLARHRGGSDHRADAMGGARRGRQAQAWAGCAFDGGLLDHRLALLQG